MCEPHSIRILQVFGRMSRGGAESRTLDLMRSLPSGWTFDFCALSGDPGPLDAEVRSLGGAVHYCRLRSPLFPVAFLRLLRRGRYDIVHSHVHYASGAMLMLAFWSGVSGRIAHFRSSRDGQRPTLFRRVQNGVMKRLIDRYATMILAVGQDAMAAAWGESWAADSRRRVIPNGLDMRPFELEFDSADARRELGIPVSAPMVLHVGRMAPPKNHLRLAELAGEILAACPDAYAVFVGREADRIKAAMIERLRAVGVMDRIRFAGERNDVPRLMKSADLFLFPSLWEGLPGAVLEACAAGTPVLASRIPGTRELADVFPLVDILPLSAPDQDWVRVGRKLLFEPPNPAQRREAWSLFRSTPYAIEHCVEAHVRAWRDSVSTTYQTTSPLPGSDQKNKLL
jgi:glycosyltransferase involved in cell wall biosynthesis